MGQTIKITESALREVISETIASVVNSPNNPYREDNIYQYSDFTEKDIQEWNKNHEQIFNVWKNACGLSAALKECNGPSTPSVKLGSYHPLAKHWRTFRTIDSTLKQIIDTCEAFFKIYQLVINKKRMNDEQITEYYHNLL